MTRLELDPWIEGYLSYLRDMKRLTHRTVIDVRSTMKKVSAFMAETRPSTPLWKLTLDDYLRWINHLRDEGSSERVIAKHISHLRGLLDYAWRSGRADRNVLDGFTLKGQDRRSVPRVLTLEEAARLVRACPADTAARRRNRIVILLLYGCGLRTAELCQLDVRDVVVERRELTVRKGKGHRQRTIPVPGGVWTELLAYLAERGGKRGPLFKTLVKKRRIGPKDVGDIVREAATTAEIEGKVTARTLRHTFATHLMDRGVELTVIASLMGHRSVAETGVYLHALPGRTKTAVHALTDEEEGER